MTNQWYSKVVRYNNVVTKITCIKQNDQCHMDMIQNGYCLHDENDLNVFIRESNLQCSHAETGKGFTTFKLY